MIEVFMQPPSFDEYETNDDTIKAAFELNPTFFWVAAGAAFMETPAEEWIRGQENSGFYVVKGLQYSPDSEYFYDFWLLAKGLSE